ncbi:hypothetical protein ACMA1D_13405, partial [Streptomyces sp. 796.1]
IFWHGEKIVDVDPRTVAHHGPAADPNRSPAGPARARQHGPAPCPLRGADPFAVVSPARDGSVSRAVPYAETAVRGRAVRPLPCGADA